ncbi:MAG: hypothetical protein WC846_04380 [Candidatus Gracilibacteria bacterium]|jgi:hypothetical protein
MTHKSTLVLVLLTAFLSTFWGCTSAPASVPPRLGGAGGHEPKDEPGAPTVSARAEITEPVQLASETLKASFTSDGGTFAYTLTYDGDVLELTDSVLTGGSGMGPSFLVSGGAEITGKTVAVSDVKMEGEEEKVGKYDVYKSSGMESGCKMDKNIVPFGSEALLLTSRVCSGDDGASADEAVLDLLNNLSCKTL